MEREPEAVFAVAIQRTMQAGAAASQPAFDSIQVPVPVQVPNERMF